jgi:hypothetical protein
MTNPYGLTFTDDATGKVFVDTANGVGKRGVSIYYRKNSIAVRNGDTDDRSIVPAHLAPYTARIFKDGALIATVKVPTHWWRAGWKYPLTDPYKIVRTPADLERMGFVIPHRQLTSLKPIVLPRTYEVMSTGWLDPNMGGTGEREDLGEENEPASNWLQGGSPEPMFVISEGIQSFPIFVMDHKTGKPVNMIDRPLASTYYNQPQDYIGDLPLPACPNGLDDAHNPEPAFLSFMATDNIDYLEILQHATTIQMLFTNFYQTGMGLTYYCMDIGQTRGVAMRLRDLAKTYKATKHAEDIGIFEPSYLLPSSYWKAILDNQLKFVTHYFMNDPAIQTFRFWPSEAGPPPWQQDKQNEVLPVLTLYCPEWLDFMCWSVGGNMLPRIDGVSGWPSRYPTPYRINLGGTFFDDMATWPLTLKIDDFFRNWSELWTFDAHRLANGGENMTAPQIEDLRLNPNDGPLSNWDPFAAGITRNAAASLMWLDKNVYKGEITRRLPTLPQAYANIHKKVVDWFVTNNKPIPARISVDASVVIDTIPPVTQPPTENPPMPNALSPLAAAVHAITTVKDGAVHVISDLVARIQAMIAAAQNSGTQVDPAELQALVDELTADKDALATAIATVPPA